MGRSAGNVEVGFVAKFKGFVQGVNKIQSKLRDLSERMAEVGRSSRNMGLAFAGGAAFAVKGASDFERAMTTTSAVAAGTQKNFANTFAFMKEAALDFADTSIFTGNEVTKGMHKVTLAGSRAQATLAQMPAAISLATAASVDLAKASDTVTNIMAGFGITAESVEKKLTKSMGRAVDQMEVAEEITRDLAKRNDVLVATFTGSNVQLDDLGKAFRKAASITNIMAGATGDVDKAFIEASASLGILGNAGIKAEEGGTALRRGMVQLEKGSGQARRALDSLGLRMGDITKHGFPAVIKQLEFARGKFIKAGKESQFTGRLIEAFGQRAGPAFAAIVSQGSDALGRLIARIEKLQATAGEEGITKFLEQRQLLTFAGTLKQTISKLDGLRVAIGDELLPIIRPFIVAIGDAAKWLRENLSPQVLRAIGLFGALGGAMLLVAGFASLLAGQFIRLTIAGSLMSATVMNMNAQLTKLAAGSAVLQGIMGGLNVTVGALLIKLALIGIGILAMAALVAFAVGEFSKYEDAMNAVEGPVRPDIDLEPFGRFQQAGEGIKSWFLDLWEGLPDAMAAFGSMFGFLPGMLDAPFAAMRQKVDEATQWLQDAWSESMDQAGPSFMNAVSQIPGALVNVGRSLVDTIANIFGTTSDAVINAVTSAFTRAWDLALGITTMGMSWISGVVFDSFVWVGNWILDTFSEVFDGLSSTWQRFAVAIGASGAQIGVGITQVAEGIGVSWAKTFKGLDNIVTGFAQGVAAVLDLVSGFAIDSATMTIRVFAKVREKIAQAFDGIANLLEDSALADFFDIDVSALKQATAHMVQGAKDFGQNVDQLREDLKKSASISDVLDKIKKTSGGVLGFIGEMLDPSSFLSSMKSGFRDMFIGIFGDAGDELAKKFQDLFKDLGIADIKALNRNVNTDPITRGRKTKFKDDETLSDFIESMMDLTTEVADMESRFDGLNAMVTDFGEELRGIVENAPDDEMEAWAADMLRQKKALELADFLNVARQAHRVSGAFKAVQNAAEDMGIPMSEVEQRLMDIDPDRVVAAQIPVLSEAISEALFEAARRSKGFDAKDSGITKMLTDAIGGMLGGTGGPGGVLAALGTIAGGQFAAAGLTLGDGISSMLGSAAGPAKAAIAGLFGMAGPIGAAIGTAVGELASQVGPAIESFVAGIGQATRDLGGFIAGLVPEGRLGGAIKNVASTIGGVIEFIAPAAGVLGAALVLGGLALGGFAAALATLGAILFPLIITIGGLVAALAAVTFIIGTVVLVVIAIFVAAITTLVLWVMSLIGLLQLLVFVGTVIVNLIGMFVQSILNAVGAILSFVAAFAGLLLIAGILSSLVTETESFKLFMEVLTRSVGRVIEALEPVMHNFRFLGGAFDFLMDVLIVFANAMANNEALAHVLFEFVKMGLIAAVTFAIAIATVQNALISFWQAFLNSGIGEAMVDAFIAIVEILMAGGRMMLNAFEMIPEALRGDEVNEALSQAADLLEPEDLASNLEDLRSAVENSGNALESMRVEMDPLVDLLGEARGMTMEELEARFDNLAAMEDTTKEMRENLINVPQGFKVALERFRAIEAGQGSLVGADRAINTGDSVSPGDPIGGGGGGGNTFIFENGSFEVATIEGLFSIIRGLIEEAAQNQFGNPLAGGGNR